MQFYDNLKLFNTISIDWQTKTFEYKIIYIYNIYIYTNYKKLTTKYVKL